MKKLFQILKRILATFAASALATLGAGVISGLSALQACALGGMLATASVLEALSRAYLKDGKLTQDEIDEAFAEVEATKNIKKK
jgi:formiminotetrahydrofolate cyclodeaminase